jgi:YgiT-type zinc finger domain-containing protein
MRMSTCPSCGGSLSASRKRRSEAIGGRDFIVTVAAGSCRTCGSVFLENTSLERAEWAIACELARHGPINGSAFRYMRKTLALQATVVAGLLEVTPETISRWENGQRAVDKAAYVALGSVVLERASRPPETLERLRELRVGQRTAKTVRLDVTRSAGGSSPAGQRTTPR